MALCQNCGHLIETVNTAQYPKEFCSFSCYEKWMKFNRTPNCHCVVCNKPMYMKPYRLNRLKHGITCSKMCANILRSEYMKGKENHQYGLTGHLNKLFKSLTIISEHGYILEYAPGHPFPHDSSHHTVRVLQHRLVIERNASKFDKKYFIEIDGRLYLKPEYIVHHINEIKTDNRLENLQILTQSEHSRLHNLERSYVRNELGRFLTIIPK